MSDILAQALAIWGLQDFPATLVAARENLVYRIDAPQPLALRLHRRGMRSTAQLLSELEWMAALAERGLSVPRHSRRWTGRCVTRWGGRSSMFWAGWTGCLCALAGA